jgi:hypothetical protein
VTACSATEPVGPEVPATSLLSFADVGVRSVNGPCGPAHPGASADTNSSWITTAGRVKVSLQRGVSRGRTTSGVHLTNRIRRGHGPVVASAAPPPAKPVIVVMVHKAGTRGRFAW